MISQLSGIVLTLLITAIPAYYLNRLFTRIIRPRESPARLFYYFVVCVLAGLAYAVLFVGLFWILTKK